jgi:hypothetical protein
MDVSATVMEFRMQREPSKITTLITIFSSCVNNSVTTIKVHMIADKTSIVHTALHLHFSELYAETHTDATPVT